MDYYKISVSQGKTVNILLDKLEADADLYVQIGEKPTLNSFICRPYNSGTKIEECSYLTDIDTDIYIGVYGFKATPYNVRATIEGGEEVSSNICNQSNDLNIPNNNTPKPCSVSTFHNLSIYWNNEDIGDVNLEYKKQGDSWKKAQNMLYRPILSLESYDKSNEDNPIISVIEGDIMSKANYRGSIVNLEPNTTYQIKVNGNENHIITATTKSESFKIKETHSIYNGCQEGYNNVNKDTCIIKNSGSKEEGYVVIDGTRGDGTKRTLDISSKEHNYNFDIRNKSYIIIRNFKLKGAKKHAIFMENSHHIVVEDCEISEWGSIENNYAREQDSAIYSQTDLHSSLFQRNKIFNPNHTANSWGFDNDQDGKDYHPRGAQAITLKYCKTGNNVIRYNEFYSTNGNYFNDVIGGSTNWSHYGFPGADSDIYGNYVANGYDDGIEAEGGGQNVRIWNNFIEKTYIAIGNAITTVGPLYIWRNVSGKAELVTEYEANYTDDKYQGAFLKMGATSGKHSSMQGQIYVYNNTILNQNSDGYGGIGSSKRKEGHDFSNRTMRYVTSRNNILHVPVGVNSISIRTQDDDTKSFPDTLDYAYDMVNAERYVPSYYDLNHIVEENNPNYRAGNPILSGNKTADFSLLSDYSNDTKCLDNIIPYANPDMGAQEGDTDMHFGIQAPYFTPPSYQICPE